MTYATQQDMIDRFAQTELVELTDRSNTGNIDTTVLNRSLSDADVLIDGYLQGRYTLPLVTVPKVLSLYAGDIARYLLYDNQAPEQVEKRYDDAIKFLQQVAQGKITLGLSAAGESPAEADGAQMESGGSVFKREDSTGFI